ncbi:zinc-alpha-2-glycoprotein-like isoform X2 [Microcebus murinus]|uniref:zinc-alpha-2-glycoprotein-like isoform X2 n=1 Tax=Microcebus murinus TaxID=30608 RepID=UPI003F6BDD00
MVPILLSLPLLLGPAVPHEAQAGRYSLTYLYTGLSRPGEGYPWLQGTVFLNDQAFFHYDSESGKAEPLGPWRHIQGMNDWEKESQLQKFRESIYLETLQDIMAYYNDSNGSHILQERLGCELQNNGSSGAFWKSAYDGKDFIEFNKEISTWVPLDPAAWNTKKKWEPYVQNAKAYLEKECPGILQRYLNYSRHILDRQDPPSVAVTSRTTPGEKSILRCQVYGFYPQGIGLHWTRDSEVQESKSGGDVLPSGGGTYLSSVLLEVPPQDRHHYSCHVEHSALAQPLSVPWDSRQDAGAGDTGGTQSQ